ncbi:MAG: hypothetical protein ACJ76Y_06065 [Thermoanaerobaculia bacterium]
MAILRHEEPWEERQRLVEEARELRRRHPHPPLEEVLAEMERISESFPKDLRLPDSTELLREDRER